MLSSVSLLRTLITAALFFSFALLTACGDDSGNNSNGAECSTRADCSDGQRCDSAGQCTSTPLTCSASSDCDFGDYCVGGACEDATCAGDDECTDAVCVNDRCRAGCSEDSDCGDGQACNAVTRLCETAGCTPGTCPAFQTCDQTFETPTCRYTGDCNNEAVCAAYSNQVDDGEDYICSVAQQRCVVKPPCGGDQDCRVGEICEPRASDSKLVCRRGCRSSDECSTGQICDEASLSCVQGCDANDDCLDGEVCDNLVCVETCSGRSDCLNINAGYICTGQPRVCQGCSDTSQCPATQFCDFAQGGTQSEIDNPSIGLCVDLPPTCPTDAYGDNHDQNDAYPIPAFPFEPTGDQTPSYCRENTNGEWFRLNATSGDVITIELNYASAGNLDVALLKSDGTEIVASARSPQDDNGNELIRYGVDLDANFLIQVRGSILSDNEPYDLKVAVAPAGACTDDAFEENDDRASASLLNPSSPQNGLQVCGGDSDFFALEVGSNKIMNVRLEAEARLGNVDLILYDVDGNIIGQSTTLQDLEDIEYVTTAAEDLVLEVRVASDVGNVDYDLEWTQRDNVCTDQFELNDTCADANLLTSGTYADLAICSDSDYYAVDLLPLQTVTFRATYDPATSAGDLDITLFGPGDCATFVASESREASMGSTVTEVITYQAQFGGRYNLLTNLFSGINVPYTLEVDIQDGPACVDDANEADDDAASANVIDAALAATGNDNILTGAKICDSNPDWYAINLAENDVLEWRVKFDAAEGDLDAYLIGPDGSTVVAAATSASDAEEIVSYTVQSGEAGTYYLRVEAKFAARATYWVLTFLNNVGPADPDCPDAFENNDDAMTAAPITDGTYGLLLCGNPVDDDWFSTTLAAGERLDIDVLFSHAQGNIDVVFYDDRGVTVPVLQSRSATDNESISYNSARDQTVSWRIYTTGTQPTIPYDMTVTTTAAGTCDDDFYAGNTSSGTAATVEAPTTNAEGLYSGLTLCEGTSDWYQVDLANGQVFEAFINFAHSQADLNLYLYDDPTQAPLVSAESTNDDESATFTAPAAGTYFIKVESIGNARVVYDLLLYADGFGNEKRNCPDPYELNDSSAQLAPIALGTTDNLLLCSDNGDIQDWYSVYVPAGAEITVDVLFTHSEGDIDAYLYRAPSATTPVDQSLTTDDNEQVTATNAGAASNYYIRVFNKPGSLFTSRYGLDISLTFTTMCMDDTVAAATQAAADAGATTTTGAYDALTLCEGTEDWFKLPNGATSVEANIELNSLVGDIDLAIVDAAGAVVAESTGTDGTEEISIAGLTGQHFVRVYGKDGGFFRNDYDLWLAVDGNNPSIDYCPDDFERNDSETSAASLPFATTPVVDVIACGGELDYYTFRPAGVNLPYRVEAYFDHVDTVADLSLEVFDPNGASVATSATATNDEYLKFTPAMVGDYIVKVSNVAGATTPVPYRLYVDDTRVFSTYCNEDAYEPNNNLAQVATLPAGPGTFILGSCPDATTAEDYFRVTATSAGNLGLLVSLNATDVPLVMNVTNERLGTSQFVTPTDGRMVYNATGVEVDDTFRIQFSNAGTGHGIYILDVTN